MKRIYEMPAIREVELKHVPIVLGGSNDPEYQGTGDDGGDGEGLSRRKKGWDDDY